MTARRIVVFLALFAFVDLNLYALYAAGFDGLIDLFRNGNAWTAVLSVDLCISLALVMTWVWSDAKRRGVSPLPYAGLTVATGSVGPLLYLARRKDLHVSPRRDEQADASPAIPAAA